MSEFITIARPYARAAFEFAAEHNAIENWQSMLAFAAEVTRNKQVAKLLSGALAAEKLSQIFIEICDDALDESAQNFIKIMAKNGRLQLLPYVFQLFIQQRSSQESTIDVEVLSAGKLNDEQRARISTVMEKRLSRKVRLNCKIDKSVIAGLIIRAGNMVIDGSVRGRLERLADTLQS
jgi:F-type H+-transporting ATPase subunit delta